MGYYNKFFFLFIVLIIATFMIINPKETVSAASDGFKLWYTVILPALFPFFVVAELLVSLKFVNILGILLEPIMRPIFRLPGCSSLVVVMGFTSGFPVGALLTKKLYEEKMLTVNEAERLVSFTNNSSPLFIIGAVGVSMFGSAILGYLLAASHYISNLIVGFLWRYKAKENIKSLDTKPHKIYLKELFKDQKPLSIGSVLGNAIKNSINNITAIAGFIVVFSVLTKMLSVWGIMDKIALILSYLLNISYSVCYGIGMGFFEITLGAKTVAATQDELLIKLVVVSIILAFSGFSIIAQIMSIISTTPIRVSFYLFSRVLQMVFSGIITYLGYKIFIVNMHIPTINVPMYKLLYSFDAWTFSLYSLGLSILIILLLILVSFYKQSN